MNRTTVLILFLALILAGCGAPSADTLPATTGSTSLSGEVTTTEAVEKNAVFDFSAIEGEWSGMIESQREGAGRFPVELGLDAEARRGSVVGSFRYPDTDDPCRGTLSALRVDEFEYVLFHSPREGDCNPSAWSGQLRLLYSPANDELSFSLSLEFGSFVGTLSRADE
jgi:hypothetical protein